MPSLPCTQQDIIRFATKFRDYESHFSTRDWSLRVMIWGSTVVGLCVAWFPLLNLFKPTDGWEIMSIMGSFGMLASVLKSSFSFEKNQGR